MLLFLLLIVLHLTFKQLEQACRRFCPRSIYTLSPTTLPVTHQFSFIFLRQPAPAEMQFLWGISPARGGTGHLGRSSANRAAQFRVALGFSIWCILVQICVFLTHSFPTHYTQTCHCFTLEVLPILSSHFISITAHEARLEYSATEISDSTESFQCMGTCKREFYGVQRNQEKENPAWLFDTKKDQKMPKNIISRSQKS